MLVGSRVLRYQRTRGIQRANGATRDLFAPKTKIINQGRCFSQSRFILKAGNQGNNDATGNESKDKQSKDNSKQEKRGLDDGLAMIFAEAMGESGNKENTPKKGDQISSLFQDIGKSKSDTDGKDAGRKSKKQTGSMDIEAILKSLSTAGKPSSTSRPREEFSANNTYSQQTDHFFKALFGKSDIKKREGKVTDTISEALTSSLFGSDADSKDNLSEQLFSSMFNDYTQEKKRLEDFKYWDIFPTQIKKWLIYTRSTKGYYADDGRWRTADPRVAGTTLPSISKSPQELKADREYYQKLYEHEQKYMPDDLRGNFRFGVKPEEIEDLHPKLKRLFSFKFATQKEISSFRKVKMIERWGKHISDSGTDAVQIAALTQRINHLTEELKKHPKDKHNRLRLTRLISRRKSLMKYLKKRDVPTYYALLKHIGVRDQVEVFVRC